MHTPEDSDIRRLKTAMTWFGLSEASLAEMLELTPEAVADGLVQIERENIWPEEMAPVEIADVLGLEPEQLVKGGPALRLGSYPVDNMTIDFDYREGDLPTGEARLSNIRESVLVMLEVLGKMSEQISSAYFEVGLDHPVSPKSD
ncbi:MAG: hypothetical protein ACE366_21280 [Bradymonadia bacterium]